MTTTPKQPWDQQEGEPDSAYSHFQIYLHLAPRERSQNAAYAQYRGCERLCAPGSWQRESKRWKWPERAIAYDVAMSERSVRWVVVRYLDALSHDALRSLDSLARRPKAVTLSEWRSYVDGLRVIAEMVPPATLDALIRGDA
jgi:hypothetical protein